MSTHDEPNFLSLKNYYNPIIVQLLSIASLDILDWSANTEATEFQQFDDNKFSRTINKYTTFSSDKLEISFK